MKPVNKWAAQLEDLKRRQAEGRKEVRIKKDQSIELAKSKGHDKGWKSNRKPKFVKAI